MLKLTVLALAALNGAALAAPPAAATANLPPPGLYRIDMDANTLHRDGTNTTLTQQANAAATLRAQKPGSAPTTLSVPNGSAQQICIGAPTAAGGFNPIAQYGKANCKAAPVVTTAAGTTFAAKCDILDVASTIRKLNATTWEVKTKAEPHLGAKGMLDFDQQRKMFQTSLKNATTAEEKADAQYTLDHWEEYKAEMRQSAAEAGAAGAPGAVTQTTVMVTRMTKLADSCKVASAAK